MHRRPTRRRRRASAAECLLASTVQWCSLTLISVGVLLASSGLADLARWS